MTGFPGFALTLFGRRRKGTKQISKILITELRLWGSLFYSVCLKTFIIAKINFKKAI